MEFKFYNRDAEIRQLVRSFEEITEKGEGWKSYLINGPIGIGKTGLVKEFFNRVLSKIEIMINLKGFSRESNILEYKCRPESMEKSLSAFSKLAEQLEQRAKLLRIYENIGAVITGFFNFEWDAAKRIINELKKGGKKPEEIMPIIKQTRKHLNLLAKRNKKNPIIIYIQNAQWLDDDSLNIIRSVMSVKLWGMLILEKDFSRRTNLETDRVFNEHLEKKNLNKMIITPLRRGFEAEILSDRYGDIFSNTEYKQIYALTGGKPGLLEREAERWEKRRYIYKDEDKWKKTEDFSDKIRSPQEELIESIIAAAEDKKLTRAEKNLIDRIAEDNGIPSSTVARWIDIIFTCKKNEYQVEKKIPAMIGIDAFLAQGTQTSNKVRVEYIPGVKEEELTERRNFSETNFLNPVDIISTDDGIIAVFEHKTDMKSIREIERDSLTEQLKEKLDLSLKITNELNKLHRVGRAHGFLKPESILVSKENDIYIGGIDVMRISGSEGNGPRYKHYLRCLSYLSPEQLEGAEPSERTDIFSLGVILYERLTNEHPFSGESEMAIKEKIKNGKVAFGHLMFHSNEISNDRLKGILKKCLSKKPSFRYADAGELANALQNLISNIETMQEPEPEPPVEERNNSKERQRKKFPPWLKKAVGYVIAAAVIGTGIWKYGDIIMNKIRPPKPSANVIVLPSLEEIINEDVIEPDTLLADKVRYILNDQLSRSAGDHPVNIISNPDFLEGTGEAPRVTLKGNLEITRIPSAATRGYNIHFDIVARDNSGNLREMERSFHTRNKTDFLNGDINREITSSILNAYGITALNSPPLCNNWDAFEWFYRGEQSWKQLNPTKAEMQLRRAISIDNNFPLAKLRLARVLDWRGSSSEAIDTYLSVDGITSLKRLDDVDSLKILNKVNKLKAKELGFLLAGKPHQRIEILKKINALVGTTESRYDIGEAYYELCDIENAISNYRMAISADSAFARGYNHLAYCYSHLGEHDKALENFEMYLKIDSTANAWDSYGDGLFTAGRYEEAARSKQKGLMLDPDLNYLRQSLCYINIFSGRMSEAERNAELYVEKAGSEENMATGYYLKALCSYYRRNLPRAKQYCLNALDIHDSHDIVTRNHELHWLKGLIHIDAGELEEAEHEAEQMHKIIRQNRVSETDYQLLIYKFYHHLRASISAQKGEIKDLENHIEKIDNIKDKVKDHTSPFDWAFLNNSFGELYMQLREWNKALERFEIAKGYNENLPFIHYNLARLYRRRAEQPGLTSKEIQDNLGMASFEKLVFENCWEKADRDLKKLYQI